jgi:hypothetical protein
MRCHAPNGANSRKGMGRIRLFGKGESTPEQERDRRDKRHQRRDEPASLVLHCAQLYRIR